MGVDILFHNCVQQLNPLNVAPGVPGKYMTAAELTTAKDDDPEIIQRPEADHQFYLAYDFNPIDNLRFHGPHIPIRTGLCVFACVIERCLVKNSCLLYIFSHVSFIVRKGFKLYTPQLNFISHVMPVSPPLTQPETVSDLVTCNDTSMKVNCTVEYCECIHLLKVELNSIVEIVLVDRLAIYNSSFRLHYLTIDSTRYFRCMQLSEFFVWNLQRIYF
jgi:L-ascorbate oxidase